MAAGIATAITSLPGSMATAHAQGIAHCAGAHASGGGALPDGAVAYMQVDPIAARGNPMSMHMHEFFGSTAIAGMSHPESANYSDLVGQPSSCDIAADTASYWNPPLYFPDGSGVPLLRMDAYYLTWDGKVTDPASDTRPFPNDLRMIAGNMDASSPSQMDVPHVAWSCGSFSTKSARQNYRFASPQLANCAAASPLPGGRVTLTASVTFPSCWDGLLNDHTVNGNTADFDADALAGTTNHMAYTRRGICPVGFSTHLPTLREMFSWDYAGDGTGLALSSGPGWTMHADFLNSWSAAGMAQMVSTCIDTAAKDTTLHQTQSAICGPPIPVPAP